MLRWLWFFAKAIAFVALAVWISQSPENRGYVHIEWIGWQVDTEVWVLLLAALLLALLIDWLSRLIRGTRQLPASLRQASRLSRRSRGYRALSEGLAAVAAGDADLAQDRAFMARTLLQEPSLTALLSAQAAELAGDQTIAERYYRDLLDDTDTAALGARGLLLAAERRRDWREALSLARQVHTLQPGSRWILARRIELECRAGHWGEIEPLLKRATAAGLYSETQARRLRVGALTEEARAALDAKALPEASELLRQALALSPDFAPAVLELARVQIARRSPRLAEKAVERAMRLQPHPDCVQAWMLLARDQDVQRQLIHAQKLLSWAATAAEAHMAVAEAALEAGKLADCRRHLDRINAPDRTRRFWALAINLEQAAGADSERMTEVLRHSADALPDPSWHCTRTGLNQLRWSLISRGDGFNTVTWLRRQAVAEEAATPPAPPTLDTDTVRLMKGGS